MSYLGQPQYQGQKQVFRFVATQGQITYTGLDAGGTTLSYTPGQATTVFYDGRRLSSPDYVANDGVSISIVQGAAAGSEIVIVSDVTFQVANVYSKIESDARYVRGNGSTATLNDSRSLAILTSKLRQSVSLMVGGMADGYTSQAGIDILNSTGAFVDTVNGAVNGGLGGQTFVMESTSSLPKMTSNTDTATGAAGYVASATSYPAGRDPFTSFNGVTNDGWISTAPAPQSIVLKVPAAIRLAGYRLFQIGNSYAPTAWVFEGSNDGSSYTPLDTQTGVAQDGVWHVYSIAAANQGSYLYHRLRVTAGGNSGDGGKIQVNELELLQYTPAFESHPSLPAMTSNTAVVGGATGYKSFSSNEGLGSSWAAFDNSPGTNSPYWQSSNNSLPAFVGRQLPNPVVLGGYALVGYNDANFNGFPIDWQFQATNDTNAATSPGGVTWTTLDQRSGMGNAQTNGARCIYSIPTAKQGAYLAYRLLITSYSGTYTTMVAVDLLQVLTGIEGQTSIPYHTGANTVVGGASGYAVSSTAALRGTGYEPFRAADGQRTGLAVDTVPTDWSVNGLAGWTRQLPTAIKVLAYRIASMQQYTPFSWQLRGSNTGNGSDWVTLDSRTVAANFWQTDLMGDWKYFTVQSPGSYSFYQLNVTQAGTDGYSRFMEVEFLQGTTGNMDLRSTVAPATIAPTKASLYLRLKPNTGTITLNTNLTASASRDGTTWTTMILTQTGIRNGYYDLEANQADISSQPAGTNMKYRVQTTDGLLGVSIDGADFRWN